MSISPTFSISTNPTSSLTSNLSPEKIPFKSPNLQSQLTSLISMELYHIDTDEITSNFNSLFPDQNSSQSNFILKLCETISNVKKSTINSLNSFFNDNMNKLKINEDYLNALNNSFEAIRTYIKLSKIKFKQINDGMQSLHANVNTLSDYVKMGKVSFALDKIAKIDEIKKSFHNNIYALEEQQTKFYDNIRFIYQKNKIDFNINNNVKSSNNTNSNSNNGNGICKENGNNSTTILKAKSFLSNYSSNNNKSKGKKVNNVASKFVHHSRQLSANKTSIPSDTIFVNNSTDSNFLSHSIDRVKNIKQNLYTKNEEEKTNFNTITYNSRNDNNDSLFFYQKKAKEQSSTIEKLKISLKNETDAKISLQSEIAKLKQQILITYSSSKSKSLNRSNNQPPKEIDINSLSTKLTKVIDMVVSFSYSMNTLRDSLFKKKSNIIDPKNDYNKLRARLVQISNDLLNVGKNVNKYYESVEENLNLSSNMNSNATPRISIHQEFVGGESREVGRYESLLKENNELKEENNSLREHNQQLANKIITFRNDNVKKSDLNQNIFSMLSNERENFAKLIEENKNLKSQLSTQLLLNSNYGDRNEYVSDEEQFKLLKEAYEKNLNEIKETFANIIKDKNETIEKMTKETIELNIEINELKEKVANFETEYRKQNILYESSLSNLKNEKMSLELQIKNLIGSKEGKGEENNEEKDIKIKKLNAFIENQKIQIKHLNEIIVSKDKIFETINSNINEKNENNFNQEEVEELKNMISKLKDEINEKNKQIHLITENHQNDLNELNTSIILLKSKIAKLQEENISLSYRDKNAP